MRPGDIFDCDELEVLGYDDFARVKIYYEMKYLKEHTDTCKWAEWSPQREERIYRGCLKDGYKNRPNIDSNVAIIKKLAQSFITDEEDVKRFVYDYITEGILMIAQVMSNCKDRNRKLSELKCSLHSSN